MKKTALLLGVFLVLAAASCTKTGRQGGQKYNIILVTIDALRADHLSVYGYPYKTSPQIDEFAAKSILFEYAYCPIPKTSASFASLMTGLHPFVHRTRPNRDALKTEYITLAEALKLKGYFNIAIVDNANLSKKFNFDQGFDRYIEAWNEISAKEESTPYLTRQVLKFLGENRQSPFFLWVHYVETHNPYLPPAEFVESRPQGRLIKNIEPKTIAGNFKYLQDNSTEGFFIAQYDGAVKYIDAEFQKILDVIKQRGYDKNSIILLSSDHGEELGEHNYFFNHGPLTFNSSIRVPLIISIPGVDSRRIRYPVSLMDIYPTLLDKVGLVPPYEIQGRNLLEKSKDRFLLIRGHPGSRAVVYGKFHLIRIEEPLAKELGLAEDYFFDLWKDPGEKDNIIQSEKTRQRLMDERYLEFFNRYRSYGEFDALEKQPPLSKKELEQLRTLGYIQ